MSYEEEEGRTGCRSGKKRYIELAGTQKWSRIDIVFLLYIKNDQE